MKNKIDLMVLDARLEEVQRIHDYIYGYDWHKCDQHRPICVRLSALKEEKGKIA